VRILFVHQNYPGQYRHLAPALAERGHEVVALGIEANPLRRGQRGVWVLRYHAQGDGSLKAHPLLADTQAKVQRGAAAARAALQLRARGFAPDLICAHPGWGEAMFLKDVWPDARMLCYLEFFYRMQGADIGFDAEFAESDELDAFKTRTKNIFHLVSLEAMDWGVSPTDWQRSRFPQPWQGSIGVIHDGIRSDAVKPDGHAKVRLSKSGPTFASGDEVVSFVNRNLEPYRGFHVFMRALPEILAARPKAQVVIVGGDGVSYGRGPAGGGSWREKMLAEIGGWLDLSRVHFVGKLPYASLIKLFQITSVHVYLTYPFVLSWSMLEAMSAGALVIGSRTAPVEEVLRDGQNGLLVDFFAPGEIAQRVIEALEQPGRYLDLRRNARRTIVQNYDLLGHCLPAQIALAESVGGGGKQWTVTARDMERQQKVLPLHCSLS
jgi:glycosyltransferase involved in cell wall biosynthesis